MKLLAVVALAVAWVCRTATDLMGTKAPKRKKHGYYAKSWCRIGFDPKEPWNKARKSHRILGKNP